ncbi:MAG: hypothetical protein LBS60_03745 [Deltaproteobacteria bacterium]|jgi:hypothetical protein|nr:hypothetical protein [Deltaproteobacteria bacterium]
MSDISNDTGISYHINEYIVINELVKLFPEPFFKLLEITDFAAGSIADLSSLLTAFEIQAAIPEPTLVVNNTKIIHITYAGFENLKKVTEALISVAKKLYKHVIKAHKPDTFWLRIYVAQPGFLKKPASVFTSIESFLYSVEYVSLGKFLDGDKFWGDFTLKAAAAPRVTPGFTPTPEELVKLILAPLGQVAGDRRKFAEKVLNLANSLLTGPCAVKPLALVLGAVLSFVPLETIFGLMGQEKTLELLNVLAEGPNFKALIAALKAGRIVRPLGDLNP